MFAQGYYQSLYVLGLLLWGKSYIKLSRAIDKGMPIEQVQKILEHSQTDTTMQYAIVNQTKEKVVVLMNISNIYGGSLP